MTEFPDTELSRRLRANWGRRLRPELVARFDAAFGYAPQDADFADLPETDRLGGELLARLRDLRPSLTWPESQREGVFAHLHGLADAISDDHVSYLLFFGGWEYVGAIRAPSHVVLASAAAFWQEGREPVCLLTTDASDGFFLDYTEPEQMFGADEYELFAWGTFGPRE